MTAQRIGTQIQPLTAKGDLLGYSTTPARVAVGSDGQTLVANSGSSTGVSWQGQFVAGKNKIINGDFGVWQRGTSFTPATSTSVYTADRWTTQCTFTAGTFTCGQQTFTAGTAPVSGYESTYFIRLTTPASGTTSYLELTQKIEDVRVFAGQTVTLSFWAKASSNKTMQAPIIRQNFGSGGSSNVDTNGSGYSLTTSWQRFTMTVSLPSISGKTIGSSSYLQIFPVTQYEPAGIAASLSIDFWGVQLESGSVATPFTTATGTVQGELAACQRYYYKVGTANAYTYVGSGVFTSTTAIRLFVPFPVTMRTSPSFASNGAYISVNGGSTADSISGSGAQDNASPSAAGLIFNNVSARTAGWGAVILTNSDTTAYLAWSAEL